MKRAVQAFDGDLPTLQKHAQILFACRACPTVAGTPVSGVVPFARILLLGQAPGPREQEANKPFAYTAGRRLFRWFEGIGFSEESFRSTVYIAAVIRCFPGRAQTGGDRVPSEEEIARCSLHLEREIRILNPGLIIAVGTLAAQQFLPSAPLAELVGRVHRVTRFDHTTDLIVLPHPSGRSTWTNRPQNRALLEESLRLIATHPAATSLVQR
ncbi:MAG TPA: uracil-DNA glycosylase family protein [Thermoanaerobaculia bacterium]|nr:uracil-DNA glycosylase family protein [Thermoanaerobaculia bacterium]